MNHRLDQFAALVPSFSLAALLAFAGCSNDTPPIATLPAVAKTEAPSEAPGESDAIKPTTKADKEKVTPESADVERLIDDAQKAVEAEDFVAAIQLTSDYIRLAQSPKNQARGYAARAIARMKIRDPQSAIQDYTDCLQLQPEASEIRLMRATCYLNEGYLESAVADLTEIARREPEHRKAYLVRSAAYLKLNQFEMAIKDATRALELAPNEPQAYMTRGGAYLSLKQYETAITDLTAGLNLKPGNASMFHQLRGMAYEQLGRRLEAATDFTAAESSKVWR